MKKIFLLLLACVSFAQSSPVSLAWNANPEIDIVNYKLSYGTVSGTYTQFINAGTQITATTPDLVDGVTYYFAVQAVNTVGLISPYSAEVSHTVSRPIYISPKGYSVASVDSEDRVNYPFENAIDGNPATFWRTNPADITMPHEIVVNLGVSKRIQGFTYLQRQDDANYGNVGNYEFYVSADGVTWGTAVSTGTLPDVKTLISVNFVSTNAKYIKFRSLSDSGGTGAMTVAELDVIDSVAPSAPTGLRIKP